VGLNYRRTDMGEWICDDRETLEEWDKRIRGYRSMSMEKVDTVMVNCDEALKLAKEYRDDIVNCAEYDNAYIFSGHVDEDVIGPQPVVVMKDTGEIMLMPEYVASGKGGEYIREYPI